MVQLRRPDIRILDEAFDMHSGYVLDFSDRTMAQFFQDEHKIDIDDVQYSVNGASKAKRLRTFFQVRDAYIVARVARSLWQHREGILRYTEDRSTHEAARAGLFDLIGRIEGGGAVPSTDALYRFKADETLEELITAIERDIAANKPAAALDRLHTYAQKKFAHLLSERGVPCDRNDPLHSRVGKYLKALEAERPVREITRRIIKTSISVFESYNDIRNNESFAHDNDLVDKAEARFIYDAITATLRLVKTVDTARFGA